MTAKKGVDPIWIWDEQNFICMDNLFPSFSQEVRLTRLEKILSGGLGNQTGSNNIKPYAVFRDFGNHFE